MPPETSLGCNKTLLRTPPLLRQFGHRSVLPRVGLVLWGGVLAVWLARVAIFSPHDRYHINHESFSYVGRLIEFRDQLRAGYLFPEWCTHFRGGLGSPHNLYYQPGLFYVASLVPWSVPLVRALGLTLAALALVGYLGMYGLVAERFGRLAGWLAASALLLASYTGTEIYLRGDLSEFTAMMVLPAILYGLLGWLEHGRRHQVALLAAAASACILLHPAVGLLGYGMAALAVALFAWQTRRWDRVAAAAAALLLGVGLAAFYWLPMTLGWNLVNSQEALEGPFHYSRNFVRPLTRLVGPYVQEPFAKALTLDVLLPALLLVSLVSALRRWRDMAPSQRSLAVFCLVGTACFTLLMTKVSKPLWHVFPLLQRMQFPWRAMTVVTVLAAAASGSALLWQRGRHRTAIAGLLVLEMWFLSWQYTGYRLDRGRVPQTPAELVRLDFAPDVCGEWVPRGATENVPPRLRKGPMAGPQCCVDRFSRTQGRLSCWVRTSAASYVVLPHYWFPEGWQARLDGRPVPLTADRYGLMRVELPARTQGELVVRFSRTRMRTAGIAVSGVSLLAGLGAMAILRPGRPHAARPQRAAIAAPHFSTDRRRPQAVADTFLQPKRISGGL